MVVTASTWARCTLPATSAWISRVEPGSMTTSPLTPYFANSPRSVAAQTGA